MERELIGAYDSLSTILWCKNFMEAQGYPIQTSYFEQDNESAIKLEKNGRTSASQRSRHIHNRFFWIKDRLTQDKITLRHCDTSMMLADFLTKPLQGSLFRKFRDVILGYRAASSLSPGTGPDVERVGINRDNPRPKDSVPTKSVTWADVAKRKPLVTADADEKSKDLLIRLSKESK